MYPFVLWNSINETKIADHQVSKAEVHDVLDDPIIDEVPSQSNPAYCVVQGETRHGRWLIVVYEKVDQDTIRPVTAYEPQPPSH
ncbi:MAG: hypothetical protein GC162_00340 [Planctomycetes bacterium]|nr:hypothetical protein [Planctomycetota bacterium]